MSIPEAFAKAFFIARSGRPGPVVLDVTKDAQFAELDYSYEKITQIRSYTPYPKLDEDAVERAYKDFTSKNRATAHLRELPHTLE
mgnify:CR=1 FL=1